MNPSCPSAALIKPSPCDEPLSEEALAGDIIRHLEHLVAPGHYDSEGDLEHREGDVYHLGDLLPGKTYTRDPDCNYVYRLDPAPAASNQKKRLLVDVDPEEVDPNKKKMREESILSPSPIPFPYPEDDPTTDEEEEPVEDEEPRLVQVVYKGGNVPTFKMLSDAFAHRRILGVEANTKSAYVHVLDVWAQTIYDPNDGLVTACFMKVDKAAHIPRLLHVHNFAIEFPNNGGVSLNVVTFKVPTFIPKVRKHWRDIDVQLDILKKLNEEALAMKAIPVMYDECVLSYELPPHFVDTAALTPKIFTIMASIPLGVFADITCLIKRPVDTRPLLDALDALNKKRTLIVCDLRLSQSEGFDFVIPGFN